MYHSILLRLPLQTKQKDLSPLDLSTIEVECPLEVSDEIATVLLSIYRLVAESLFLVLNRLTQQ